MALSIQFIGIVAQKKKRRLFAANNGIYWFLNYVACDVQRINAQIRFNGISASENDWGIGWFKMDFRLGSVWFGCFSILCGCYWPLHSIYGMACLIKMNRDSYRKCVPKWILLMEIIWPVKLWVENPHFDIYNHNYFGFECKLNDFRFINLKNFSAPFLSVDRSLQLYTSQMAT